MDNEKLPVATIPLQVVKQKQENVDLIALAKASSGFLIVFGFLILGTGLICLFGFANQFSKLLIDIGLICCTFGFMVQILDVLAKIVTGFRK